MTARNGHDPAIDDTVDFPAEVIRLDTRMDGLIHDVVRARRAAEQAAMYSAQLPVAIADLREDVSRDLARHYERIAALITDDARDERRVEHFEQRAQEVAARAISVIATEATQHRRSLSARIVIPVGAITALGTVAEWLVHHFHLFGQ